MKITKIDYIEGTTEIFVVTLTPNWFQRKIGLVEKKS